MGGIRMSEDCGNALDYNCPFSMECNSESAHFISTNPLNPHLIYIRSKNWSESTKTWSDKKGIYSCQPKENRRKRNIELMSGETFYEKDAKKIREGGLKESLNAIKGLIESKSRR